MQKLENTSFVLYKLYKHRRIHSDEVCNAVPGRLENIALNKTKYLFPCRTVSRGQQELWSRSCSQKSDSWDPDLLSRAEDCTPLRSLQTVRWQLLLSSPLLPVPLQTRKSSCQARRRFTVWSYWSSSWLSSLQAQLGTRSLQHLLLHCKNLRKVNVSDWNITKEDFDKISEKLDHDNISLVGPK